jgi:hypothetical protein
VKALCSNLSTPRKKEKVNLTPVTVVLIKNIKIIIMIIGEAKAKWYPYTFLMGMSISTATMDINMDVLKIYHVKQLYYSWIYS